MNTNKISKKTRKELGYKERINSLNRIDQRIALVIEYIRNEMKVLNIASLKQLAIIFDFYLIKTSPAIFISKKRISDLGDLNEFILLIRFNFADNILSLDCFSCNIHYDIDAKSEKNDILKEQILESFDNLAKTKK
jgi:hypothetical protein